MSSNIFWGISALNHDASLSVIQEDGEILFAAHSERYSKIKNDPLLNQDIFDDALKFGKPDCVAFFENRWLKKTRQLYDLQFRYLFDLSKFPGTYLKKFGIKNVISFKHHESHAAASYYTSGFQDAIIVVIDSLGEWNTITIWEGKDSNLKLLEQIDYPSSLGLLYSAFTQRCGFKPNEEEYILMGMAAFGKPIYKEKIYDDFIDRNALFKLKRRCESGIQDYMPDSRSEDLAASIQEVLEECVEKIMKRAKTLIKSKNLVYSGGVALNCVANSKIAHLFENIWIMPNPGDSGSSLGCAALLLKKQLKWKNAFLGRKIDADYPVERACNELLKNGIVGVANGRAEFGPRALGNRSLLADPRNHKMKNKVNEIKKRQKFRPFAPSILNEETKNYFEIPVKESPYMQFVAKCLYPLGFPAICHVDSTSRLQTVSRNNNQGFYDLLQEFKRKTGCPMLLNTSLNIKGQPIVNDENDAKEFSIRYKVKVF